LYPEEGSALTGAYKVLLAFGVQPVRHDCEFLILGVHRGPEK
jgi:hypothetical protein